VANAVLSLIEIDELRYLRRVARDEFWIAVICTLSVLVLGSLQAVIIAFIMSTVDLMGRVAAPNVGVMVRLRGARGFAVNQRDAARETLPGLIVYRFGGPLYFANATAFEEQVEGLVSDAASPIEWLILDAEAMHDLDSTGAEALSSVLEELQKRGTTFGLARAQEPLPSLLATYDLLDRIGHERMYATVRDAVEAFHAATQRDLGAAADAAVLDDR
jgi:SulP family sulfate permease